MAAPATAIGLTGPNGTNDFMDAIRLLTEHALPIGERNGTRLLVHNDPSGARVCLTIDENDRIVNVIPSYQPRAVLQGRAKVLHPSSQSEWERTFAFEVHDRNGNALYPLPVRLEDLALAPPPDPGSRLTVHVAALAEKLEYSNSGTSMQAAQVIPLGLFRRPEAGHDFEVTPHMLMTGTVAGAEERRHALLGGYFAELRVNSSGASFVVAVAEVDLPGLPGEPHLPDIGTIISGQFYLSGRVGPAASAADHC